ncbi:hypothetical protein [Halonatronum saccharophilum]|uniref:hypothetical protein n=1 Tax=Halonatronum saccharophilum TaxID=150060 RepID=UPI000488B7BD|nr:hypothetical protein [Halonatronum saccharophilum]
MKKITLFTLIILTLFSINSFAYGLNNNLEILGGRFNTHNAGELVLTTFNYIDDGGNLFLPSDLRFSLGEGVGNNLVDSYNELEIAFYHQLDEDLADIYLGLGYKNLNKKDSIAKKSGWSIPITLKGEFDLLENTTLEGRGQILPFGNYSVTTEDSLNFSGDLKGYNIDLSINHSLTDTFALKLGYLYQSYTFGDNLDNKDLPIAGYEEHFNGLYFGGRISF